MRIITTRKVNRLAVVLLASLLVIILAWSVVGHFLSTDRDLEHGEKPDIADVPDDAVDTAEQIDKYKVRSELLMEAMKLVGVCSPEEAVDVWVTGLMKRSAAIQYAVMNDAARAEYVKHLEKTAPNWVTGMSSPWVSGYEVVKSESPDENTRVIRLKVSTETSTGPAGTYNAVLTIAKEDPFWRISKLSLDEELYPYTGFELRQ